MQNDWNSIVLRGEIEEEPKPYCYNSKKKTTNYLVSIKVKTRGNRYSSIPVILPESIEDISSFSQGSKVFIKGILGTHRVYDEKLDKNRIRIMVKAFKAEILSEFKPLNSVIIEGFLVSKMDLMKNRRGESTIIFLIASNNEDSSNYIRCSAEGERADFIDKMNIGDRINIHGFIYKNLNRDEYLVKTFWLNGFDKAYRNKDGFLFGEEEGSSGN